jgi:hypothetical protein
MKPTIISGAAALAAGALAMGAGAAAGAPSVAISGSLQDGSTVTAVVRGGKAKATQWQRCPAALRAG